LPDGRDQQLEEGKIYIDRQTRRPKGERDGEERRVTITEAIRTGEYLGKIS